MSRPRPRRYHPAVESLDHRRLLAPAGLSPAQIERAYALGGQTFGGRAVDGAGQTIAIVDAYNDPNLAAELSTFDATFNLPAPPSLTVLGQTGTSSLPRDDAGWAGEEALDVEWAHAIAPGSSIVLVETNSSSIPDLIAGVKAAASQPGVSVVSMSWGGGEFRFLTNDDPIFTAPGITFVASSGDDGLAGGAQWPASSGSVVGVGGTTLQTGPGGTYQGETPWPGSGGGTSVIEAEPSYQEAVQSSSFRTTPDVAFDGDTGTGVAVYSIAPSSGHGSWLIVGGTSLGAPAWAAIMALVDQGRVLNGARPLGSSQTLTGLYSLPASDFHVIGSGYNNQTGLGTPNGSALLSGLVQWNASSAMSAPPGASTPTPTTPAPPINNWPVISTPVITAPVSQPPVASAPVVIPVTAPPAGTLPPTASPTLTPPPAAPPVRVKKVVKKTPVSKHAHGHTRLVHPGKVRPSFMVFLLDPGAPVEP
jgi:subtilase family serine protease